MRPETAAVTTQLQQFFEVLEALARDLPAPGLNAANAYFQQAVADLKIENIEEAGSTDASRLKRIYLQHRDRLIKAFQGLGSVNGSGKTASLAPVLGELKNEIVGVYQAVMAAEGISEESLKRIKGKFDALFDKIKNLRNKADGSHANGWVSVRVRDGARKTREDLDVEFPRGEITSDVDLVAEALRTACLSMERLPTDGHDPWLRAEWQVTFEGICSVAAAMFKDALQVNQVYVLDSGKESATSLVLEEPNTLEGTGTGSARLASSIKVRTSSGRRWFREFGRLVVATDTGKDTGSELVIEEANVPEGVGDGPIPLLTRPVKLRTPQGRRWVHVVRGGLVTKDSGKDSATTFVIEKPGAGGAGGSVTLVDDIVIRTDQGNRWVRV